MGICLRCKNDDDLRLGFCFDCATAGERKAANRSALQHVMKAVQNACKGNWSNARYDLAWAIERLTRTGDYAPGGVFEREYGIRL